jgi:drug/metabolite transporter superfamily protein YnfA
MINMNITAWFVFIAAALLEVGGDAAVRRGLRGRSLLLVLAGMAVLGGYGLVVNSVRWDFSKLLGVYVAFFALVSVLFGRFAFKESIAISTWLGVLLIMAGGMIIQFGQRQ